MMARRSREFDIPGALQDVFAEETAGWPEASWRAWLLLDEAVQKDNGSFAIIFCATLVVSMS